MSLTKISFEVTTFHGLGKSWIGRILAPVFAFPLLFLFRMFFEFDSNIFYWTVLVLAALIFVMVTLVLRMPDFNRSSIVLDETVGNMVSFIAIPFKFKLMLFGYILFFVINFLRYPLFKNFLGSKLDNLPGAFGIFAGDLFTGFITNIFLQLLLWVVY